MTLPTFFIIGAPKTGTTSLYSYLVLHPEIQMSAVKEPNFFAPTLDPRNESLRMKSRKRYEGLFDSRWAVRGEASTAYAEYPFRQGVPERIKSLIPEAKLIYVVRDPVARMLSHYHHSVAGEGERRSLEEIVASLPDPRTPCICASLYRLQTELYLQHFAREAFLFVDHSKLLSERQQTVQRVFEFLGVDPNFHSQRFDQEFLRSDERRVYPPALARVVRHGLIPRLRWLPAKARHRLRSLGERTLLSPLEQSTLDERMRSELEEYFAEDVTFVREATDAARTPQRT